MKKNLKTIFSLIVASTLLFGGCAPKKETPTPTDAPKATNAETDKKADTPTDSKISILTSMAYGTDEMAAVIENFKKANPGIQVDVQHVPNGFEQTLASRINSGDIPDIFVSQTGSAVSAYYEYAYDFTNDPVVSKFKESSIEISKNKEGKILSLPWTYESMGFIVSNKIFKESGITEMPKTIKELELACEKIKAAGYTPFAAALKETWVLTHIGSHFVAGENKNPEDTISKLNDGSLTFKDMKYFDNLFDLLDLTIKYGPEKPLEVDWEVSENKLANNQAGIIHMGDWCESTLVKFNADTDVTFMPVPISNDSTAPTFLSGISWQFVQYKDSKNLEKSKELLEYLLTSDDGIEWMTKGVKAVPAAKTDKVPEGMLAPVAQKFIASDTSLAWNHVLWPNGFNPKFGSTLQAYLLGEMTREEVKDTLDNEWKMAQ